MDTTDTRYRLRLSLLSGLFALTGAVLTAGEAPKTQMAPFRVEAEFGVDGLRIQNSASVLNQYQIAQHGIGQMQDVTGLAPNLYSSNTDSRGFGDILALRGIANSIFFGSPAVALYVDGVPSGSVSSYPSELLNIESFVVKAGPQGTDYGRNAAGGVIDIRTQAPGGKHQGFVLLDYGFYNASSLHASFDGPVNQQLGYSLTLGLADREGYIKNTFRRTTVDDRRSVTGRGALHWRPDPKLQVRLGFLAEKFRDDGPRLSSLLSRDPYAVSSNVNGETRTDRRQLSLQATRKFDWGTLIATTSHQDWEVDPATNDLDFSPLALASSEVAQSESLWTQEIRFESHPGADKAQWRAGVFYSDSTIEGNALRQFVVPPSAFVPPGFIQSERTVFALGQRNTAGYANLDHPLTRETTLKLGVRAERTAAEIDRTKASSNNFRFPSPQDPRLLGSQSRDYLSASAGLGHAVSNALSLIARTSLAQRPHGYSGFTANPLFASFSRERLWSNEVGVTFGPPKGRFGGSVLGFWNVIDGYQFERTVPNSTDFVVVNAREVTSRGLEAKFMWQPIERVWWDLQAGLTHATFENHRDARGASVNGKRVPFIPSATLRTGVTVDLGRGLSANASYAAIGRTYFNEQNTATFAQKTYGVVNARIRYAIEHWTAAVYAQNVFEKTYYQFINPEVWAGAPGAPRRVGVQLSYRY